MSEIPERIINLSPAKLALLNFRLKTRDAPARHPIKPRPRSYSLRAPLSFAQQRLWFLNQLQPDSTAYNLSAAVRLKGRLDTSALNRAVNEVIRRHEALRTHFVVEGQDPWQVIVAERSCALLVNDLTGLPESEREDAVRDVAAADARQPFDLGRGPLLRVRLLRMRPDDHILLLTIHHIISDAWSMTVLVNEVGRHYTAFLGGGVPGLQELPIQYADYAVWQREWLRGDALEAQVSYWREQLKGAPAAIDLPIDYERPSEPDSRSASGALTLPPALCLRLRELSQRKGCTLFMTLLAAFKLLLSRQSGQTDVVVGAPVTGRRVKEIESLIGFFVNTLALRTDLSGSPTFCQLLERVRETALKAQTYSDLPFEKLVEELQPARQVNRPPFFEVTFNFLSQSQTPPRLPGLSLKYLRLVEPEAKFALTLYVYEQGAELKLHMVYQQALFSPDRIGHLLRQYERLLEQAADAPDRSINDYSLVTDDARRLLPDPSSAISEPRHQPVPEQFLAQAKAVSTQIAISQGGRNWSYGELAQSVEALVQELLAAGQRQGEVVAVMGARSFGLVSSLMSTLMSGGVLLPVDPALPLKRKVWMLREAAAKRILYIGESDLWDMELISELSDLEVVKVDALTGHIVDLTPRDGSAVRPLPSLLPEDAAYIFFTSGSTGVPKGVRGCHKGLSHFVDWQRNTFRIGPQDRIAQLSLLSFDAMLRDIFLPLTSGATLCLPPERGAAGAEPLLSWLDREAITCLHTVPSIARAWLQDVPAGVSLRSLRYVFFAGEPLPSALVRRWREVFPESGNLVNFYGPTETTMIKCFYCVPDAPPPLTQPAGFPLPQTQALVLAGQTRLCGIGEIGEIVLRTPFGTLGYLNGTSEDQQRFVVNPFRTDDRDVLYRTGDYGRYRLDGSLDILGRLDQQIKVRGVRIEPGEVEAALVAHPSVDNATVVALEDPLGEKILVAYLVMARNIVEPPEPEALRDFLRGRLPEYMIPSVFVSLKAMPLTPNGKVDRKALPLPEQKAAAEYVAPSTPIEVSLAEIWGDLLRVERVGVHDNFFDLGGHSLMATRVVSRVRETFHVDVSLSYLFKYPTVAGLARVVEELQVKQIGEGAMMELVAMLDQISEEEVNSILIGGRRKIGLQPRED